MTPAGSRPSPRKHDLDAPTPAASGTTSVMQRPRRWIGNMSVATRLSLVALVVTLVSLAVTAAVGLQRGSQLADGVAEDRLVSVAAARSSTVELYLRGVQQQLDALAASPGTAQAIEALGDGYRDVAAGGFEPADADALTQYYLAEVVPPLSRVRGETAEMGLLVPRRSGAVALQSIYTVVPEPADGELPVDPELVVDAGDGSTYSAAHARLHPLYGGMAARSGFDDLFLIDAQANTIVYSVQKRTDFATSLDVGPLSNSSLATLISSFDGTAVGQAAVIDFAPYTPVGDQPRLFVATPVVGADGAVIGYVAVSLTTEPFDEIVSGGNTWSGFGTTGDAYVVGADNILRTATRRYVESPAEFVSAPDEGEPAALTAAQRRRIRETGTNALVQSVEPSLLALADGSVAAVEARGDSVLATARPVDVEGLDWVVVVDAAVDEINRPIEDYARDMLFAVAFFVVVVTFVAVRWSERVIAPIRSVATRLREVRAGSPDTRTDLPENSPTEYVELAASIDQMLERLVERRVAVADRVAERADLLAEFLPSTAAQRSAVGDDVLDHVPNATVVAMFIDGVGVEQADPGSGGELLAVVVDQLDALALDFGLVRVQVTGSQYVAVCGVNRPYLDHVPRSVGFALAASELVADLSAEHDVSLRTRAGVDVGAVTVGVTGRDSLVYDAWGATVRVASDLARRAAAGEVAVSAGVRQQLPDGFVIAHDGDLDDQGTGVAIVTGRTEPSPT